MSRTQSGVPQISPAYTGRLAMAPVPSLRLPDEAMDPQAAYSKPLGGWATSCATASTST